MKERFSEISALVITLLGCTLATLWPFSHEERILRRASAAGDRVITLTGVAASGTWTEEEVHGGNYWRQSFSPARPVLLPGVSVLFRLKSADVVHTFYSPALGIGPLEVYPGNMVEARVTPKKQGVYAYYCTTMCGDPHFGMRGQIVVRRDGPTVSKENGGEPDEYWLTPPPPNGATRVEQGEWLYRRMGCVTCHGREGKGGVSNWNYIKDTVPPLNTLAERMMLYEREDAEAIVQEIENDVVLESLVEDPPVPRFNVVLAQYNSIMDVIRKGNPAGKKEPEGPAPPLDMPSWKDRLSKRDIESVVAFLLTLQPWEEDEDEDILDEEENEPEDQDEENIAQGDSDEN